MADRWGFNRPWTTKAVTVQNYDGVAIFDSKGKRIVTLFGAHRADYADMIVKSVTKADLKVAEAKHEDTNPESDDAQVALEAKSGEDATDESDERPPESIENNEPDDEDDDEPDAVVPEDGDSKGNGLW